MPVDCRLDSRSRSAASTRLLTIPTNSECAISAKAGGRLNVKVTEAGIGPSSRKKWFGRVAVIVAPLTMASYELTPGQSVTFETKLSFTGLVRA